ncbi:MAG TPA: YbjN domain-containing protein [Chloroflexaceae bacterium]|nr:YbjN domain-containing protein [Chloroflexaceae bacterium]
MSDHEPASPPAPARRPNGARALATLGRFLADDGWRPTPAGPAAFSMAYSGEAGAFTLRAEVLVEAEQLVIIAEAPTRVPAERLPAAAEYVCRACSGLYVGSLELDFATGVARARCGLDFEGEPLSPRLIRNALAITVRLMETYMPGLARVVAGEAPRAVIGEIEG